jgi:hypothetical protein
VVPANNRDGVTQVRPDHHHRRILPFIRQERGDPPDSNPGRHQGDDPTVTGKRRPKGLRAVGDDFGVEHPGDPPGVGEEPFERYHGRPGHE